MTALFVALGILALVGLVFVILVCVAANELLRIDRHME